MKILSLLPWILVIGCGSKQPPGIPPGVIVTPPDPPKKKGTTKVVAPTATSPTSSIPNPVTAAFVDVKDKKSIEHVACETRALVIVKGKATAAGESLNAGDMLLAQGKGSWEASGDAVAVSAILQPGTCDSSAIAPLSKKVIRATKDPSWVFPNGTMKGWLDLEGANATIASIGRMEGIATVPEHVHETSWEVLCAFDAKGTLMLNGSPQAIAPRTCTAVPPNTRHAWTPDAGSKLVAVQFYAPPGPEQRFKTMSGADAGAPPAAKPDAGPPVAKPDSGAPAPKR